MFVVLLSLFAVSALATSVSSPKPSCPAGQSLVGPAIGGFCPPGTTLSGSDCCAAAVSPVPVCATPVGPPNRNGLCPAGSALVGDICCSTSAASPKPSPTCPAGSPVGPPMGGLCPPGTTLNGNVCCGTVSASSPMPVAPLCPVGASPVGPALGGFCSPGTTLNGGVCCASTVAASSPRPTGRK